MYYSHVITIICPILQWVYPPLPHFCCASKFTNPLQILKRYAYRSLVINLSICPSFLFSLYLHLYLLVYTRMHVCTGKQNVFGLLVCGCYHARTTRRGTCITNNTLYFSLVCTFDILVSIYVNVRIYIFVGITYV